MEPIQFQKGCRTFAIVLSVLMLFAPGFRIISAQSAAPLVLEEKPLRYSLQEGDTTLIICVPKASLLDQFIFVNENTAARGALKIAVSNAPLPASDPKWNPVNGDIAFVHKRLFNLSLVGVDAKYVKLSFHVQKEEQIAAVGL